MQDNLAIWNAVKQPPASALRPIQGGRLRGKTDICPQWRYLVMTEQFGICGIGWKYEVTNKWTELISTGEMFAFADVKLYIRHDGQWSEPIPGHGGSMLLEKESSGLHASDEGYKMAITDALSVAMKMLGIAADVYSGAWDGTKYSGDKSHIKQEPKEDKQPTAEHWCAEHNCKYEKKTKGKEFWYSHKLPDGTWCNESKKKDNAPKEEQPDEPEPPSEAPQATPRPVEKETSGNLPEVEKPVIESSVTPLNIQALYNWITSHGKKYTRSWFLGNFNYTEEELKDSERCIAAYQEVKTVSGWEK